MLATPVSERALVSLYNALLHNNQSVSAEKLAEQTRYSPVTIKRAIVRLESQGVIRVIRPGPPIANSYEVNPDRAEELGLT